MTDQPGTWPETIPATAKTAAERWPDRIALIEGDERWAFAQLWADARACGSAMLAHGVAHGDRIGIWAPNSRDWIIAALDAGKLT